MRDRIKGQEPSEVKLRTHPDRQEWAGALGANMWPNSITSDLRMSRSKSKKKGTRRDKHLRQERRNIHGLSHG